MCNPFCTRISLNVFVLFSVSIIHHKIHSLKSIILFICLKIKLQLKQPQKGPQKRIRTLVGDFLLKNALYKNRILILPDKGGHYTGEKCYRKR